MKSLILPRAIGYIIPVLFVYKIDFGIKLPTKVDTSLKEETKPNK